MATSKPKVQGYVSRDIFEQFEVDRVAWGLSQSQALERILNERYGIEKQHGNLPMDCERITVLEESLESLNQLCKFSFELAFQRIGKLESITSNSQSDTSDLLMIDAEQITAVSPSEANMPYAIALLDQRNQPISFWRGGKQGFVDTVEAARHYKGESGAKRQVSRIDIEKLPSGTRVSYKPVIELLQLATPLDRSALSDI